ncbi:hypothetical protein EGP98_05515 [bacterium]|nr:hypothetical protein [bacterium]
METLTNGVINMHVDPKDKEEATSILKDSYSNDLENALKESTIMEKEYKDGKRNDEVYFK